MDKPVLPVLGLFPTYSCNFHCVGCAAFSPFITGEPVGMTEGLRGNLSQLSKSVERIDRLTIIGGEPFLLPNLHEFIDEAISLLKVPIGCIDIITNASLLVVNPIKLLDLPESVNILTISVHPELRNQMKSDSSLSNYFSMWATIRPDIQVLIKLDQQFDFRALYRDRHKEVAQECEYPYKNMCISISDEGLHKCGIAHSRIMQHHPYKTKESLEAAKQSTVSAITPESVRSLLSGPVELCHYCTGTGGGKLLHLDVAREHQNLVAQSIYSLKLKCDNVDILIPYKKDSVAREKNLHRLIAHLYTIIEDPHITVIEGDKESTIPERIKKYINHIFVRTEGTFSHSNLVNVGITWTKRPIVFLQGGDVLTRQDALEAALKEVSDERVMIPQNRVANISQEYLDAFPLVYATNYTEHAIPTDRFNAEIYGGVLATRKVYDRVGMYGKQFEGWGHEDFEFEKRCEKHGIITARADCTSVHMDHPLDSEYYNDEISHRNRKLAFAALGDLPQGDLNPRPSPSEGDALSS